MEDIVNLGIQEDHQNCYQTSIKIFMVKVLSLAKFSFLIIFKLTNYFYHRNYFYCFKYFPCFYYFNLPVFRLRFVKIVPHLLLLRELIFKDFIISLDHSSFLIIKDV